MPATVTVRYWAGAQRAAGVERESLTVSSVGELRAQLQARAELARIAAVASFLVDGVQADDDTALFDGAEVDVLPPFAGGAVERLTALVQGRVQGVGFRYWVRREAESLGLTGSASNLPDGRVEVVLEGPDTAVAAVLGELDGPRAPGTVRRIDTRNEPEQGSRGFTTA